MAMMLRTRALTLAAAVAAAAGLLIPAVAARAASGLITVTSAGSPASSVGQLSVSFDATSTVVASSVAAELYAPGASTPAMAVTDFTQTAGPGTGAGATTWTVATPIPYGSGPGELPLGTYTIEVQASDQGGDSTDDTDAGTLAYLIQPTVTLSVSPAAFSYGQNVTLSGTDTGLYPDGSDQPVAGQEIEIDGQSDAAATTGSDGSFSLTLQAGVGQVGDVLTGPGADSTAVANATTAQVFSNYVQTTVVIDPMRITETVNPSTVTSGTDATISGTVSFESGSTWLPLAGATLQASVPTNTKYYPPLQWTTTTDASGNYTFTVLTTAPHQYTLGLNSGFLDDWMSWSPVALVIAPIHVPVQDQFSARMTGSGQVQLTACTQMVDSDGGYIYEPATAPFPPLQVQYATSANGPWRTLLTAAADSSGCHDATVKAPGLSDYYRTVTAADTAYLAGASPAEQAYPATKSSINGFYAGPRRLRAGQLIHVRGFLYAGRDSETGRIQILFRPVGSKRWRVIGRATAHAFKFGFRAKTSGYFEARYIGAEYTLPCQTRSVYVRVLKS
jgi:hypothetical protein